MAARNKKNWIANATKNKGALHRALKFPADENIPKGLLAKIDMAVPGDRIQYKVDGKNVVTVITDKLKKQVRAAMTMESFKK